MRQWYFGNIPEFRPEVEFQVEFDVEAESRTFRHRWKVSAADAPNSLSYLWDYPDLNGLAEVHFRIEPLAAGSKLNFTQDILNEFPDDIPEFTWENCMGGWNYFLKEQLPRYLQEKQNG